MNTPITPLPELADLTSVDTAFQEVHVREETVASVPGVNAVPDLPRRKAGPLTAKKLRTVLITYVTVHFSSLLLLTLDQGNALSAFALGMMAPGGGLWFSGHHLLALLTVGLVLVAVTANRYALPGLWLGGALLAASLVNDMTCSEALYAVPLLGPLLVTWIVLRSDGRFRKALATADHVQATLSAQAPLTIRSAPAQLGDTLDDQDLAHAKFILDRALQPLDAFNGLKEIEPYGTSALRYQLNYAQYALAMLNYCHTPAFSGYLHEAQRRLIQKMTDLRAWGYWRGENVWGNLDFSPDPIRRDNIMFSAYLGQMLGMYATVSGDPCFSQPGALTFRWKDGRAFEYDHASINHKVMENFQASEFCLYPCEPNWSYTMCNPFGLNTLLLNDRLFGTGFAQRLTPDYRRALMQEFMTPDGHFVPLRSMLWGINIPGLTLDVNDAMAIYLHHPGLPDVAETTWEMLRQRRFRPGEKFPFEVKRRGRTDIGNYRSSTLGPYSALMMAAQELGDREVYRALQDCVAEHCPSHIEEGELVYAHASNFTSFMLAIARFSRPGAFHDLVNLGMPQRWQTGPQLLEAPYPDVLVYRAVSDGAALSLGLKATVPGLVALKLGRLVPGKSYRLLGAAEQRLCADANGECQLQISVANRQSLRVVPVY